MERPWASILGMYQVNPEIFDGFKLPEELDREALLNELLAELAELEVVYMNPDVLK